MKKTTTFLFSALLGLSLSMAALLLSRSASVQASPGIHYVAPGGSCGSSLPSCFANLQAAVDAAAPGDEIRVAAGLYSDVHVRPRSDTTATGVVTQSVYLTKSVTIRGGYNSDFSAWDPETYATTLDAQDRAVYFTSPETSARRSKDCASPAGTPLAWKDIITIVILTPAAGSMS